MKQTKKKLKKQASMHAAIHYSQIKRAVNLPSIAKKGKSEPEHIRAVSRLVWLNYMHSWRIRARLMYIVFSKRYPRRTVCSMYCTTYASRKRCEHIKNSPLTRFSVSFAALLCLLIAIQLAYPRDRALPLARLEGHGFVGLKTYTEIADSISSLDDKNILIKTDTGTVISSYREMGLAVDTGTTFSQLNSYSTTERIIPFSIFLAGNKTTVIKQRVDDKKLNEFVQKIEVTANKDPQDATITIDGIKLKVAPAQDGHESSPQSLKRQILRAKPGAGSIVLSTTYLPPQISTESANAKARLMQARIDTPLTIKASEITLTVDAATLAGWVDITPMPNEGTIELSFNKTRVENFLRSQLAGLDQPAKPDVVTLLNGLAAGNTGGASGRILNLEDLASEVAASTNSSTTSVWAKVNSILPGQLYDRRYSRDSQGIQNLIDYWAQTHAGQHGIDFRSVNGRISASVNPSKQFSSAGSSRLYVAHLVYGRLAAGSLQGDASTSTGLTVNTCLDRMLRLSDNACRLALGTTVGWGNNDAILHAQSFVGTTLASSGGSTTAGDTSGWFAQLLNGSLTTDTQKNSLIDTLSRQSVRTGIPAGSPGMSVVNAAGSSSGQVYDMAIIYHPRGTYILSVLSDGGSLASIAELTAQINRVLNE